jgi:hypothetical protein
MDAVMVDSAAVRNPVRHRSLAMIAGLSMSVCVKLTSQLLSRTIARKSLWFLAGALAHRMSQHVTAFSCRPTPLHYRRQTTVFPGEALFQRRLVTTTCVEMNRIAMAADNNQRIGGAGKPFRTNDLSLLVRSEGLEPPRFYSLPPQAGEWIDFIEFFDPSMCRLTG